MAYRQENDPFAGYGSSYPFTSRMPGYAHQQDQDLCADALDLQTALIHQPGPDSMNSQYRTTQSLALASLYPTSQNRSAWSSLSSATPHFQAQLKQPLIVSPSTRRLTTSSLDRLLSIGSQDRSDVLIKASDGVTAIDKLVLPSEMPIGSLVHTQRPQEWGVVKIANVSDFFSVNKNNENLANIDDK